MKLTLSRQKIVEALSVVCKAITKNSLPVLQYVNLGFNENILILRATNLDLTIIKTIRPENLPELLEPNQSKLLPGSVVLALLSKSAEDKVTFCWEKQDNGDAVRLQFGSHKSQIKNIPPVEDFPLVPEVKAESFSVGVAFCFNRDASKRFQRGVFEALRKPDLRHQYGPAPPGKH